MTQKDAKVNTELALSSAAIAKAKTGTTIRLMKKVAIDMKETVSYEAITLLGMFFLPGTFVAVS